MSNTAQSNLAYAAFGLLAVSVVIHLLGGLHELYAVLTNHGTLSYALLLLLGAFLPIGLVGAMVRGVIPPAPSYALFAGLMVVYIAAYADVHAFGYLESLTGAELHANDHNGHDGHGHDHDHHHDDDAPVETVIDHLAADPIAVVCKVGEGTAAVLFATLSMLER